MDYTLGGVAAAIQTWQLRQFGPADPAGVGRKLVEEALEVQAAFEAGDKAHASEEVADVFFLVLDCARACGMDWDWLAKVAKDKLVVNMRRTWCCGEDGRWSHTSEPGS